MTHRRPTALVLLLFSLWVVASAAGQAKPDYVVTVPVANMYASASEDSDVVSQALLSTNVTTLETQGNWSKVRTPDQYSGWIPVSALRAVNQPAGYGMSGKVVQVESLFANLYREKDVTTHQPLMTVPFEARLEVIEDSQGEDERWLKVRLPDQRMAWVQRGDVTFASRNLTIPESIALAKRFLGIPYLWGGRSTYGYDCSGFTQMLMRSRGIVMPRDADVQAAWEGVVAIDRKDLQAGDLLFFGPSPNNITHTAMYIGSGEMIHATVHDHPVIQISRLDDQPWTRILVACRRVK